MSEKMLVTQALDERDLLVKKIADKIAKASFIDTIKPNEDKVFAKRIDKEEYAKEADFVEQVLTEEMRILKEGFRKSWLMNTVSEYSFVTERTVSCSLLQRRCVLAFLEKTARPKTKSLWEL